METTAGGGSRAGVKVASGPSSVDEAKEDTAVVSILAIKLLYSRNLED